MGQEKQYITLQEAAALLETTPQTFRKLVKKGVVLPEFRLGMNFAFSREKIESFKSSGYLKKNRLLLENKKKRLLPPTQEELELLNRDLHNELNRTKYAKDNGVTRQSLQLKIYSIAYRKLYFDRQKSGE